MFSWVSKHVAKLGAYIDLPRDHDEGRGLHPSAETEQRDSNDIMTLNEGGEFSGTVDADEQSGQKPKKQLMPETNIKNGKGAVTVEMATPPPKQPCLLEEAARRAQVTALIRDMEEIAL
ncbi:MAG: hypothetical protein MMC33_009376 [Icmadophila ericetorum]|nr:hypothetical protein [Icmadophila ericetorum]